MPIAFHACRCRRVAAIVFALVVTTSLMPAAACGQEIRIPSIVDMALDVPTMARLAARDGQLIVVHPATPWHAAPTAAAKPARFATASVLVPAAVTAARAITLDFAAYPEFFDQVKRVRIIEDNAKHTIAEWELALDFSVVSIGVKYTLEYSHLPNGAAVWRQLKGEMDGNFGAFEFIPVDRDHTLIVHTAWADIKSQSWLIRKIFELQPDLETAVLISNVSVVAEAIRRRITDLKQHGALPPH